MLDPRGRPRAADPGPAHRPGGRSGCRWPRRYCAASCCTCRSTWTSPTGSMIATSTSSTTSGSSRCPGPGRRPSSPSRSRGCTPGRWTEPPAVGDLPDHRAGPAPDRGLHQDSPRRDRRRVRRGAADHAAGPHPGRARGPGRRPVPAGRGAEPGGAVRARRGAAGVAAGADGARRRATLVRVLPALAPALSPLVGGMLGLDSGDGGVIRTAAGRAPATPFNQPITPHRRVAFRSVAARRRQGGEERLRRLGQRRGAGDVRGRAAPLARRSRRAARAAAGGDDPGLGARSGRSGRDGQQDLGDAGHAAHARRRPRRAAADRARRDRRSPRPSRRRSRRDWWTRSPISPRRP